MLNDIASNTSFFGIFITGVAYVLACAIQKRFKSSILNPLLVSCVILIIFMLVSGIDYNVYLYGKPKADGTYDGTGAIFFQNMLTPTTVCLAIPLYEKLVYLKKYPVAIIGGILAGMFACLGGVLVLSMAFGLDHTQYVTLLPKSITTAIGMGLAVTFVMGIILSLEQQKADIETIRAVRVAAMGPLGGIGDAIFWFTLVPITAGITSNMAINGSLAGPILFLLIFNIVQFACRFFLMYWSYNLGTKAIDILTANAKEFTRAASMLGVFIVGALTSNYGGTTVATVIENGDSPIVIQSILDGVLPKLIPLALTLGLFFLMKKKNWKPVTCIALLLVIGLVGAFFGIFA